MNDKLMTRDEALIEQRKIQELIDADDKAANKCGCPDCKGNCEQPITCDVCGHVKRTKWGLCMYCVYMRPPRRPFDMEKCRRCGKDKRKHRQCQCQEPYVITHKRNPGDSGPMYGDDDDIS